MTLVVADIASRIFDGSYAESELEDQLYNLGVSFERLGWDSYDNSLEIYGVEKDYRLSEEAQRAIHKAGFSICYVNHTDFWETHYHFNPIKEFVPDKGWRVSYPHKRPPDAEGVTDEDGILVEEVPKSWPVKWLETGYVKIRNLLSGS